MNKVSDSYKTHLPSLILGPALKVIEAIFDLLSTLNLDELSYELRHRADTDSSMQRKQDALKRLNVIESFRESQRSMRARGMDNRPEWMIMNIIPVIPPDLRPLVPLDGGRSRSG